MTTAYEHVNGTYGRRLENPEVSYSKNILGIPSVMDSVSPQPTVGTTETRDPRRIQHVRVPDEPYVQGRVMEGAVRLEQSRQLRNPAMEPTRLGSAEARPAQGYAVRTFPARAPRTRSTSRGVPVLEPSVVVCRARPG